MGKVLPLKVSPNTIRYALTPSSQEAAYQYTLDMLMEDFGKKHLAARCVLCEPMRTLGLHRHQVILRCHRSLFLLFFPDFDDYLLEVRESLVQKLLRRETGDFPTWQDKLMFQLKAQIRRDAWSLLEDVLKHLKKYCEVDYGPLEEKRLLQKSLEAIFQDWVPEKFRH